MRTDSADLPWHQVIRSSGRPAPHLASDQLARLRAEGVLADGRVPLSLRHDFGLVATHRGIAVLRERAAGSR